MPQGDHIELFQKRHGKRLDAAERARKREARAPKAASRLAMGTRGIKAKLLNERRFKEKISMKKTIAANEEREVEHKRAGPAGGALPAYLLDREETARAKVLSNTVKQKRKEKAGKWAVPLPKVRPVTDDEMFKVLRTGKRKAKAWKRMVTKVTFVGENFTRKPPKYERFVRPMALRFKRAHVTHPELKATFHLDIIGVKKNPSSAMYTALGVITKGTVIEVNVSELGLVTTGGKVVWGKYAQVTNNVRGGRVSHARAKGPAGARATLRPPLPHPRSPSSTGASTPCCSSEASLLGIESARLTGGAPREPGPLV